MSEVKEISQIRIINIIDEPEEVRDELEPHGINSMDIIITDEDGL